jgi:hypothetical protein
MEWLNDIAYFFGGVFLSNAIPHFVSGLMGRPFQSPFAKPSGQGLSSSVVNVLWGFFNIVIAYLLLVLVGRFDLHSAQHALALGSGLLLKSLMGALRMGRFNGGNTPGKLQGEIGNDIKNTSKEEK